LTKLGLCCNTDESYKYNNQIKAGAPVGLFGGLLGGFKPKKNSYFGYVPRCVNPER